MRFRLLFSLALALVSVVAIFFPPALAFSEEGQYPQRIVSLGPINTENIFLLEAQDRMVANTSYCIHPAAARDKVKIGSVMQLNIEQILGLHPDLILATGLTSPQQVAQLAASGGAGGAFSPAVRLCRNLRPVFGAGQTPGP